jgi:4-amino-4-deoxy-L-arabinose transferase-like glycosyltransferase
MNRRIAAVFLISFLLLALSYSVTVPPFEAPDEVGHFYFSFHLLTKRTLPVQCIGELGEAHQPPLYYALAALAALPANLNDPTGAFNPNPKFIWAMRGGYDINAGLHGSAETFPFRGQSLALHLARVSSILMGLVTLAFTILIAWKVFPESPLVGLLAGALVAFNPQFIFINSSVNNDNLLTMIAAISWWQVLRAIEQPELMRHWIYLGILIGLGFLAKINGGLVIAAVAGITLLTISIKKRSPKLLIQGALSMVLVAVALSGWWFLRNQILYGDILGWKVYQKVFEVNLRQTPLQWRDVKDFFSVQFHSFWGVFGWMNIPAPHWFYQAFKTLCLIGLLGLAIRGLRHKLGRQVNVREKAAPIALLFLAFIAQEAYMLAVITKCNSSCYQGRYMFPAIAPIAIILSWGLTGLLPRREKLASILVLALALLLASIAVFALVKIIAPAYEIVPIPTWRLWFVPYKTNVEFGSLFRLRGYDIHWDERNGVVTVTLYWEALQRLDFDYSVFVHLIDESGQIITQKDHAPGYERNYPPTVWLPGDIIEDPHQLKIPQQWPKSARRFRIGVYNWATGEQLPAFVNGNYVGNFTVLICVRDRFVLKYP